MGDIGLEFNTTDFQEFAEKLRKSLGTGNDTQNVFNKHMETIMKKSQKYVLNNLKAKTPKGPTGNLKKSALTVARSYKKNRKWFTATGFSTRGKKSNPPKEPGKRRTGSFLGFHAGLVEFGTNNRKTKGLIASSFNSTNFTIKTTQKGKNKGRLRTSPGMPKGFFKRAPAMGAGGVFLGSVPPRHMIKYSAMAARESVLMYVNNEQENHITKAWKELNYVREKKQK